MIKLGEILKQTEEKLIVVICIHGNLHSVAWLKDGYS